MTDAPTTLADNPVTEIAPGLTAWDDETRPCFDPDCDGIAELEMDGEHRYFDCPECGSTFGHDRVPLPQEAGSETGSCAIGVPESTRRMFSPDGGSPTPVADVGVPVMIGRKPKP